MRYPGTVESSPAELAFGPVGTRERIRSFRSHPPVTMVKADGPEATRADSDHRVRDLREASGHAADGAAAGPFCAALEAVRV